MLIFKIIQDSEFENTMKLVNNSGLFDSAGQSKIDGRTFYKEIDSKSYNRFCKIIKIMKIMHKPVADKLSYREHVMDKIHGHIEPISTLEDHVRGFYPSA